MRTDLGYITPIAVRAEGCMITGATTEGTIAADGLLAEGKRKEGYDSTHVVDDGAYSAVVLDWSRPRQVEPAGRARPVLELSVGTEPPADGCSPCTLSLVDGLAGRAAPVDTVVTHAGWAYRPVLAEHSVSVCAR